MYLTKKTTVEEKVEVKLPGFFKNASSLYYATEKSVLKVQFVGNSISVHVYKADVLRDYFKNQLELAVSNQPATSTEFFAAWQDAMDQLQSAIYPVKANLHTA